jgi:hypothetical protein
MFRGKSKAIIYSCRKIKNDGKKKTRKEMSSFHFVPVQEYTLIYKSMGIFPTIGFAFKISPYLFDCVPLLIGGGGERGLFCHFLLHKYILLRYSFPFQHGFHPHTLPILLSFIPLRRKTLKFTSFLYTCFLFIYYIPCVFFAPISLYG